MSNARIKFPYSIMENLSSIDLDKWQRFYDRPIIYSRNSRCEEGLWRRTQNVENKDQSDWKNPDDMRRRMVHYEYRYDLIHDEKENVIHLGIFDFYLWWHVCFPRDEILIYLGIFYSSLQFGGWKRVYELGEHEQLFSCGDLYIRILKYDPVDNTHNRICQRHFPSNYLVLEVSVFSGENRKGEDFLQKPWKILSTGIRTKDKRGEPDLNPWFHLQDFFPAQIELGCGPSIEAGIPPLNYLHDVYCVTNKIANKFIFSPYEDKLISGLMKNPKESIILFSEVYRRCFLAEPTNFYFTLRDMYDKGLIVGPIITNNFDGLSSRVGLSEMYVRRYDETHVIPKIDFHPQAKSLFVIGSHADRRRIQHAARERGLLIVYVDPEGYRIGDQFNNYPLESPRNEDILFRVTADEFANKIREIIL